MNETLRQVTDNERIQAIRNRVQARDFMYWSGGYANDDVAFLLRHLDEGKKLMAEGIRLHDLMLSALEEISRIYSPACTDRCGCAGCITRKTIAQVKGGST